MRTTLLLCLVSVSFVVVALTLVIVHSVLQKQIRSEISADLQRSILTFRNIETQRQKMIRREVSLLAALPVLKSLMTSSDARTIRDGALDFYSLSGADLLALADQSGKAVAVFTGGLSWSAEDVASSVNPGGFTATETHYLMLRNQLYAVASQPLYFGPAESGTRLGYVLLGYAVDRRLAEEVSQATSASVIFYADRSMVAATLDPRYEAKSREATDSLLSSEESGNNTWLAGERFVHASTLLSGTSIPVVQLVVLKSYDQASRFLTQLNRELLTLGIVLLLLSGLLAVYISTTITRSLDKLVAGARAFGAGNFEYQLRRTGPREIQELGAAFDRMRNRLRVAQEELLATERLATIGRMASSISHDLRHFLSAVYANAEFLGYENIAPEERLELLGEVRHGVRGMTDLIESLLLFSRTGESLQLSCESLSFLLERALGMVRAHPDAQDVHFHVDPTPQVEAWLDALKIERALYNLLLNGSQAARQGAETPTIRVSLADEGDQFVFRVCDNGPGVPESVRVTLFQPFVSEGKTSGVGLGLTLAHKIAQEHGGGVTLEESRAGYTVFRMSLSKSTLRQFEESAHTPDAPVVTH
jgi:signal transduction histidine kinase